jgi:DNA-binding CsgD family transcriptional regulator
MKCQREGCPELAYPDNGKWCSREHAPFAHLLGVRKPGAGRKQYRLVNGDPEKLRRLSECAARGMSAAEAIVATGITRRTVKGYRDRFKIKFRDGRSDSAKARWAKARKSSSEPQARR